MKTATAKIAPLLALAAAFAICGCFTVKTESEIKPIHITMDVNLKVDKELDKAFAGESMKKPQGNFVEIKEMMTRKVAGINNLAMLEPREGATDDDKILIAETNSRNMRRFQEIAQSSGVAVEAVQKRQAKERRDQEERWKDRKVQRLRIVDRHQHDNERQRDIHTEQYVKKHCRQRNDHHQDNHDQGGRNQHIAMLLYESALPFHVPAPLAL